MGQLLHGDCREAMQTLADASVDAVVTDPPYELGFMGKSWDSTGVAYDPKVWRECLRVLKPGGHLLAFGGTRTWHRVAVAVEDAGFEIRDSIAWMHGQGFPKGKSALKPAFEPVVVARKKPDGSVAANMANHGTGALNIDSCRIPMSADDAKAIVNMSGYGRAGSRFNSGNAHASFMQGTDLRTGAVAHSEGRWPANVILDESQALALDQAVPKTGRGGHRKVSWPQDTSKIGPNLKAVTIPGVNSYSDSGGASRFFYVAKASKAERPKDGDTFHATVKPLTLMRYLVKLVTPTGGIVLDPFAGSGTTIEACILEAFDYIGIEQNAEYLPLIQQRLDRNADLLPIAS